MAKLTLILILAHSDLNLSTERMMTVENPGTATMITTCVWWKYYPCRVALG